jgi:hypothetical protein
MSKPLLVPSLSMQFRRISPAPSFSQVWANCKASTSRPSRPPFTVQWYQQYLERKIKSYIFLISYCVFLNGFWHSPNHIPTTESVVANFFPTENSLLRLRLEFWPTKDPTEVKVGDVQDSIYPLETLTSWEVRWFWTGSRNRKSCLSCRSAVIIC